MNSQSWGEEFWAVMTAPASVADFLLGIAGAALAFGGAFWLFRRQLDHDRRLARQQLEADRSSRMSDVRRAAASKLGFALIETADEFNNLRPSMMASLMGTSGSRAQALGAERLWSVYRATQHEVDLDATVIDLWRLRRRWWEAVSQAKNDPRIVSLSEGKRSSVLFYLVDQFFSANGGDLTDLGRLLLRWDGDGAVPSLATIHDEGATSEKQARETVISQIDAAIAFSVEYG